jgi:moderate conductance mechanosensitive channel
MFEQIKDYISILPPNVVSVGIRVIGILIAFFIVHKFSSIFVEKMVRKTVVSDRFLSQDAEKKREDTLIKIIHSTFHVLLIIVTLMMILSSVGIDIGPMIAAAGIAGLAFGFGGQYLIRDIISGLFVILENQYRVNDVVCLDGTCGSVEDITLRMTTLRDLDGTVHHIPHGAVSKVANMSKYFSRVNLNIGVSYNVDLEKVIEVTNKVGNDLAQDPEWKEKVTKAPQFLRVNDFGDSAVEIKILGETKPIEQWAVAGELRKRLKIAYDRESIEIPFPQRVIHSVDK